MSSRTYPTAGSTFDVEAVPVPGGLAAVQLNISSRRDTLTPAGLLAAISQIHTYYDTSGGAKVAAVARGADRGHLTVQASVSGVTYTVLSADVAGEVAAFTSILQTAANVT